jgi:hypothetical protein
VAGDMKFQTREAVVAACIVEINSRLKKPQQDGGAK